MRLDYLSAKLKKIHAFLQNLIVQLILHLFFAVGIGLTAIIAKLFGRRFLTHRYQASAWQAMTGSLRSEKSF